MRGIEINFLLLVIRLKDLIPTISGLLTTKSILKFLGVSIGSPNAGPRPPKVHTANKVEKKILVSYLDFVTLMLHPSFLS